MIDLHMHSLYSEDGEFSPESLVQQCAAAGITQMAVTDHNCVRANAAAEKAAGRYGITCIPGVEIDCCGFQRNFHVLGYGITYRAKDFAIIEERIEEQSIRASYARLEQTRKMGFAVTAEEMAAAAKKLFWKNRWTGELFAEVLLQKPEYRDHPLLKAYRPGGQRSDNPYVNFYWDYYAPDQEGSYVMQYPSVQETIDLIHRNGGAAVLAHPGINLKGQEYLLKEISALGLDGVEAYSSYHTPDVREYYVEKAREYGLLITGGSDYHGAAKPAVQLGAIGGILPERNWKAAFSCLHFKEK